MQGLCVAAQRTKPRCRAGSAGPVRAFITANLGNHALALYRQATVNHRERHMTRRHSPGIGNGSLTVEEVRAVNESSGIEFN